ncbi:eukaryotic translation initiation factor 4E type 1B isoform X3 [Pteropus vampyrus]|uniref:Eukaryotic translation initiation factor 4E type 1B isoform X3 n=1 Tax=Pteropus vampyrus TaxID=132908 RepID=A0A6P6CJI1_PTEVA|nr:eukaryotic translation initiation factor 4E type 1B isoform X3 [Pteropus vampyrus]
MLCLLWSPSRHNMATNSPVGPSAYPSCSKGQVGLGRLGSQPTLTLFFGQLREAESGLRKWEKEEKEKEKEKEEEEEEKEAAAARPSAGEEALGSPQALLSLRREAWDEGPVGVKPELHLLQSRVYSHIQLASKLSSGCDYALFKDGIEPMWEDPRNKRGGRWLVSLAKQQRHIELDRLWLETLLCLIGESFEEYSREVCGAVINIRTKGDKIAVWTREAENQTGVLHIGRVYKEHLGLSTKTIIGYQAHADTATKSNTLAKNKFVV